MALGALAGSLGERIFGSAFSVWASWLASGAMAGIFLALAVRAWRGQSPHFAVLPKSWLGRAFGKANSLGLGLLTAALPCGWLQTFVLSAVATKSAAGGAILLACFWVGTLPALTVLPALFRGGVRSRVNPRVSAVFLILAGVGSLAVRVHFAPFEAPVRADEPVMSCHHR
jgi:sulfite exporter TauE/SafE